jgi:hypothetical protein
MTSLSGLMQTGRRQDQDGSARALGAEPLLGLRGKANETSGRGDCERAEQAMNGRIRMSGQRWARIMRDTDPNGGSGGGGGQTQPPQGGHGQPQQGQGQGGSGSGGGGPGQPNPGDFWAAANGQQQGGQGQGGQQGGGQQQGQPLTLEAVQQLLGQQQAAFQSELDRRVNQIVNGRGRQQNGGQGNGQQGNGQQNGQEPPVQQPSAPAVDWQREQDIREARSAFREYVGDAVKFLGPDERALAHALGQQALSSVSDIASPDIVGKQIADSVASQLTKVRELYKNATINVLKAKGQYVEEPGTAPGAGSMSFGAPAAPAGNAAKMTSHAAAMAAEWNTRNGHQVPAENKN